MLTTAKYYFFGGQRVALRRDHALYYIHTDHIGSTTATVNTATGGVERQLYKPYGEPRGPSGALPTDRQFTGQRAERTDYVGQVYDYGARLYSPVLGRFLSADTIVPQPGDPQALNRYSYTLK